VGLRWWNEVDTGTGDSHWVFESSSASSDGSGAGRAGNATDSRFFWMALYVQPLLWVALAVVAIVRLSNPIWLSLVGEFWAFSFAASSVGLSRREGGFRLRGVEGRGGSRVRGQSGDHVH